MKLISTLPIGEYKVIINQFFKCNPSQEYKIQHNFYIVHTKNTTLFKGNITLLIPFDDTMSMEFNLAMRDSFGKWRDNTLVQKSPKACSVVKQVIGNSWNNYLNSFGIKNHACPISPGVYTSGNGMDTSIFKDANFPRQFIYGTYKLRYSYNRNNEILSCNNYVFEIKRL
ncbi:uncharacterized protein LOC132926848 [Rhopalosiphum padi]|uniref:uncharacterized protein LOC132926848 n=1 Tax=Rhopalosiphum padi TaxID=40932 RepID=UPI00298DC224|nr:uncharacterized protein LOC132926848 [Rhopalosiphum padi]